MDKINALVIAKKYIESISKKYIVQKALLFGSFARGNSSADSDIDIAIVLKNFDDILETQVDLMKFRRDIDVRIEPHPFKEKDFINENPMVSEILKYGIEI